MTSHGRLIVQSCVRISGRLFFVVGALALLGAGSRSSPDPAQTVREWYGVVGPGSGSAVGTRYGTLNGDGPYRDAYSLLSPRFRARTSLATFLRAFSHTAFIRLDQAETMSADAASATVFVEDERDVDLTGSPATVRYFGSVRLSRGEGGWKIEELRLKLEDSAISLRDAGHGSEGYVADVAIVAVARYLGVPPQSIARKVSAGITSSFAFEHERSPIVLTYKDRQHWLAITLAKLYSGAYVPLFVHDLALR